MKRPVRTSVAHAILLKRRTPASAGYRKLQDQTMRDLEAARRTRTQLYVGGAALALLLYGAVRVLSAIGE